MDINNLIFAGTKKQVVTLEKMMSSLPKGAITSHGEKTIKDELAVRIIGQTTAAICPKNGITHLEVHPPDNSKYMTCSSNCSDFNHEENSYRVYFEQQEWAKEMGYI